MSNKSSWISRSPKVYFLLAEHKQSSGTVGASGQFSQSKWILDVLVLAGETHQDYAIFGHHNGGSGTDSLSMKDRTMYYHVFNHDNGSECNIPIKESNYQACMALVAITRRITTSYMESNSSGKFKPVVWSNVPDLRALAHSDAHHMQT